MVLNCKNSPTQGPGEAEPAARVTRRGIQAAGEHEAVTVAGAAWGRLQGSLEAHVFYL